MIQVDVGDGERGVREELSASSDTSLVVALARYQQQALGEVYRRHAGSVFGLAKRLLVDQAKAEEVVQEVFLRLWNQPERFDPGRGSLRSFLLAQTHSRAVDVLRSDSSRRRREERDARQAAGGGYDLDRAVWDLALAEQVRSAMDKLHQTERAAVELAYFGGRTYREVAEELGEAEGTVKSRIRSGLKRLRAEMVASGVTVGDI
ncbi:MAG: polymerase, sigma-24 subunit, subfamily [Ilumatobacteraceae bacterium]|nr:polymerase, sigma-24 subunit, subfamily [Ilumatobacteraceae bacterium]